MLRFDLRVSGSWNEERPYVRRCAEACRGGRDQRTAFGQEGLNVLQRPSEGAAGDAEQFGHQRVGAELTAVEHGGQDAVGRRKAVLGARSGSSAALVAASGVS